jgi:hypothetical protein
MGGVAVGQPLLSDIEAGRGSPRLMLPSAIVAVGDRMAGSFARQAKDVA